MTNGLGSPNLIRIFVGAPVQNRSEHDCLRVVNELLSRNGNWAYLFANFHASGRQIDLAVFTEKTTLIIEAKGYFLPVRGGMNGLWEQAGPYGERKIGNAYNQALEAKNSLRDELQHVCVVNGYPNAAVVNAPSIPNGSDLTSGDFKVAISGLEGLGQLVTAPSGALLTQHQCQGLARHLRLDEVTTIDAALNEEVFTAERACDAYLSAFEKFYEPLAAQLIADQYNFEDLEFDLFQVQSLINGSRDGLLIHGPAGCGKSLLATSCAMACAVKNCLPIFVSAKNFDGELLRLVDKEATLLDARSARSLIALGRLLGKHIVLFLDGYNECREDLKSSLTRSLKVFSQRYGAGIVVSTQQDLVRSDLLMTKLIRVARPNDALKARLAGIEERSDHAGNFRSLLAVVHSGLEAHLVGQVGQFLPIGASRFALFETFARTKLEDTAPQNIRMLSEFADVLVQRACFSLTMREFDRLCDSVQLDSTARHRLMRSQLLQARGDRISFIHELLFSAFTAEAAIRAANGETASILVALASPRFFLAKVFILGAIDDEEVLHDVLKHVTDGHLLAACARGECGAVAQSAVGKKIESLLELVVRETKEVRFQIVGDGWDGVAIDRDSLVPELKSEFGRLLGAVGQGLIDGLYLDIIMTACRNMDAILASSLKSFAAEAKDKKIPLRHALFSSAYVMSREAGISQIIYFIHSGGLAFERKSGAEFDQALRNAWPLAQTPGECYFLIGLARRSSIDRTSVPYFVRLLQNIRDYPYHVQLEAIDFSKYLRNVEEPHNAEIIEALQKLLGKLGAMMNSIIFEALSVFGALEDEEQNHIPVIRNEIQDALASDGSEADLAAWSLYSRQFDHPFDAAYWEEIQGLDEPRQKQLFIKACRGAEAPYLSFLGILIRRLSEFNDPEVASVIARWAVLPDKRSFMPQDAVEVLISAHEALGCLAVELPLWRGEADSAVDHALLACMELAYWSRRKDLTAAQISARISGASNTLLDHSLSASAGALLLTTSRMLWEQRTRLSLVQRYPELCLTVCRKALSRRNEQISYFQHEVPANVDSIARFAIQVIGENGGSDDLSMLRSLCDHQELGTGSLKAIAQIEERTRFPNH
jgi:hypothetical protein